MDLCVLARADNSDNSTEKIRWLFILFSGAGIKGQAVIMKGSKRGADEINIYIFCHNLCAEDIVTLCNGNGNES